MDSTLHKVRFSLRLPPDLAIRLDMLSESQKRIKNEIILDALSEYADRQDKSKSLDEEIQDIRNDLDIIKKKLHL